MFKRTLLMSTLAISSAANAYMFEATYEYSDGNIKPEVNGTNSGDIEPSFHLLDVRVYMEDVSIAGGAWEEAAFLDKASYVNGQWRGLDVEVGNVMIKSNDYLIGGQAVINDFIIRTNISTGKNQSTDDRSVSGGFGFGSYIGEHHALTGDITFDYDSAEDAFAYRLGVNYHGYLPIGDSIQSMSFDGTLYTNNTRYAADNRNGTLTGFSGIYTYYPLPQVGVGAEFDITSGSNREITGNYTDSTSSDLGLFVHYYPINHFRLGFNVMTGKEEDRTTNSKTINQTKSWAFNVRLRF
ncbi:Uncharacterised protein [BD1-7 clade bacterium]|uniref:Porin domain-containing protein n=1 Tax=BD1-7 clade bacterium TaxID=2029982 RepID=A0A5S9P2J7_9GAMM|nr:Uncharacterised protein [BD1-7 clade bacterium]CAA0109832.1 Uncharacterised protein [BD1-7 clade bacterium]CAA0116677.1 Uncharacterised protein [BD1-7 clade bacterium]